MKKFIEVRIKNRTLTELFMTMASRVSATAVLHE